MSTITLAPLSEYLETSYRPDCDYLEGELLERNGGEWDHSRLQGLLDFGVRYVWLINPCRRRAFIYTNEGVQEVKDGILHTANPDIRVPLAELE